MTRNNLIITADDFGISQKANDNILALTKAGKISRVSVIPAGIISANEVKELNDSGVKIDLHLVIPSDEKTRIIQGKVFRRLINFILAYFSGKIKVPLVRIEWEKQLTQFNDIFGRMPDGINSHEYIHFFPAYFKLAVNLAEKRHISFIRFGRIGVIRKISIVSMTLNFLWKRDRNHFLASNLESSDYVLSLDWIRNWSRWKKSSSSRNIELIIHPEREDEFELIKNY